MAFEFHNTRSIDSNKLWGGRFSGDISPLMERFNASIGFDKRMWAEDIKGSQAYAAALETIGILTKLELESIMKGFNQIRDEWMDTTFTIKAGDEDIHTANERRLKEIIGDEVGGKIHTGRSRNDQVITDLRMWMRNAISILKTLLKELIQVFCIRAEKEIDIIMPGYTHLQKAQPIRWSHWLLSHATFFCQDLERLGDLIKRVNILPLGSGALAGNPFNIDRDQLAKELGFDQCSINSMMVVGDRDFVAEFLFWASLTSTHLSKFAEDLILYSTQEFDYVTLADAYCTGSSLMPHKKNADGLELIRGKTGKVIGNLIGLLVVLKGLPSTFNKDLQEDKVPLFDSYDTLCATIQIATGTLLTLKVNEAKCLSALSPNMLSTDVAYYLVKKNMPFREAHSVAGHVVRLAESKGINITDLPITDLKAISPKFEADIRYIWNYQNSVEQYQAKGGTSKAAIKIQLSQISEFVMAN